MYIYIYIISPTAKDARNKWRNLRISYLRYLRQMKSGRKKILKPYYLLREMSFMDQFVRMSVREDDSMRSDLEYEVESEEPESILLTIKGQSSRYGSEIVESHHQYSKKRSSLAHHQTTTEIIEHDGDEDEDEMVEEEGEEEEIEMTQQQLDTSQGNNSTVHTDQLLTELAHPDLSFFRSILPDVDNMTLAQKSKFKLAVLASLNDILYGSVEVVQLKGEVVME